MAPTRRCEAAQGGATRLAGVWARRPEASRAVAEKFGAVAVPTFAALIERCDAVAFAVPPDVQAELATIAARAAKHLMLDKPLALTTGGGASGRVTDAPLDPRRVARRRRASGLRRQGAPRRNDRRGAAAHSTTFMISR